MTLETGEILNVRTFDRGVVKRQLARFCGYCRAYNTGGISDSRAEGREPIRIGFPVQDVLSEKE